MFVRVLLMASIPVVLIAIAAYLYLTAGRSASTDDAYVQADNTTIAPKVSGYLAEVLVGDNQPIKAGQVLARIDPRDYRTALDRALADVAAARASVDTLNRQIAQQKLVVEQDRQQVASDLAALVYSQQDFQRYTKGVKDGWGSPCSEPS
jgi:membrane fusion protein (multidrug efflux system)